jgi:hypothetical protein
VVDGDVFQVDLLRFADQRFPNRRDVLVPHLAVELLHAVDGPEEVHRCGTSCGQSPADFVHLRIEVFGRRFQHSDRDTHGGRDTDRGRAANHHRPNRLGDFPIVAAGDEDLFTGQTCLVDHHDACVCPLNCFHH